MRVLGAPPSSRRKSFSCYELAVVLERVRKTTVNACDKGVDRPDLTLAMNENLTNFVELLL
jgi:hypothetical protein